MEEHAAEADAAFRAEFGAATLAVVLLAHYREHAQTALIEYFQRLTEQDAAHVPATLTACLAEVPLADADLQERWTAHLPRVGKAYKKFAATEAYDEAWEELESAAWELFEEFDAAVEGLARAASAGDAPAKAKKPAPKKAAKPRVATKPAAGNEDDEPSDDDPALDEEIAGLDWSAMARSLATPPKKTAPAGLDSLLKAFGEHFDRHGEYPTVDELAAATSVKKSVIEDAYDDLEEAFVAQRLD